MTAIGRKSTLLDVIAGQQKENAELRSRIALYDREFQAALSELFERDAALAGAVGALQEIRDLLPGRGGAPLPRTLPARERIDRAIDALVGGR